MQKKIAVEHHKREKFGYQMSQRRNGQEHSKDGDNYQINDPANPVVLKRNQNMQEYSCEEQENCLLYKRNQYAVLHPAGQFHKVCVFQIGGKIFVHEGIKQCIAQRDEHGGNPVGEHTACVVGAFACIEVNELLVVREDNKEGEHQQIQIEIISKTNLRIVAATDYHIDDTVGNDLYHNHANRDVCR